MSILLILLLSHFIADFYLQPDLWAEKKEKERRYMVLHCAVYAAVTGLSAFLFIPWPVSMWVFLIIVLSHFLIDILKSVVNRKKGSNKSQFYTFCIDQILHIGIIAAVFFIFSLSDQKTDILLYSEQNAAAEKYLPYILLFGILLKPASIFVKKLLLYITPDNQDKEDRPDTDVSCKEHTVNISAGSLIGKIERVIIALLIIYNAPGALGLVIAAKSLARYKQFENQDFTEKFLVGTLSSTAIAILCTFLLI